VTDDPSVPDRSVPSATHQTGTYRVEAHNRLAVGTATDADPDREGGTDRVGFDFRLTRSGRTPSREGTALDLLAGHLSTAAHAITGPLDDSPRVARVVVDGAVAAGEIESASPGSGIASVHAALLVETPDDDESVDEWRRVLRDHPATQTAVPTGARLSLSVARVPGEQSTA
jgi:hypothetical protein